MPRDDTPERSEQELAIMRELAATMPQPSVVDVDPEHPAQHLDDVGQFHIEPFDVDAQPSAEAEEDLDMAAAENVQGDSEPDDTLDPDAAAYAADTGELYGVRTPHAGDPDLSAPEDQDSFEGADRGETWLETLGLHATEGGPAPEQEVVADDETDDDDTGEYGEFDDDRPVADRGSGGPAGL